MDLDVAKKIGYSVTKMEWLEQYIGRLDETKPESSHVPGFLNSELISISAVAAAKVREIIRADLLAQRADLMEVIRTTTL